MVKIEYGKTPLLLRPHHILCTRAFRGKGYSALFVQNLYAVIDRIRNERKLTVVSGCDAVCRVCPQQIFLLAACCRHEERVQNIDENVIQFLGIWYRSYSYDEIELSIKTKLTETVFNTICASCEWRQKNICTYTDVMRSL